MSPERANRPVRSGFASLSHEQLRAVSRMGGSVKRPKGFALLTPEQRTEVARKGALAKHARDKLKKEEEYEQDSIPSGDGSSIQAI